MRYALFDRPAVTIYDKAEPVERDGEGRLRSTIGDEGLYGQSCQVVGEDGGPMVQVRTFYGYPGYVRSAGRSCALSPKRSCAPTSPRPARWQPAPPTCWKARRWPGCRC